MSSARPVCRTGERFSGKVSPWPVPSMYLCRRTAARMRSCAVRCWRVEDRAAFRYQHLQAEIERDRERERIR
jgi:hypothetical protein